MRETALMEHHLSELTLNPAALPLFSTMARRAHDLHAFPPEMSILEFVVAEAEALFASWPQERIDKLPIFVELFQAAATTRTKESALSAPMRIIAADPDSREIAEALIEARLLTLYGQRWDDAEVKAIPPILVSRLPSHGPAAGRLSVQGKGISRRDGAIGEIVPRLPAVSLRPPHSAPRSHGAMRYRSAWSISPEEGPPWPRAQH